MKRKQRRGNVIDMASAETPRNQPKRIKLMRYRSVQVNFRVSSKWLRIVNMLASLEGRSSSALMRELLTLGLAQYINIHYRTPQLIREQQLQSIGSSQLQEAVSEAKAKAAHKKMSSICYTHLAGKNGTVTPRTVYSKPFLGGSHKNSDSRESIVEPVSTLRVRSLH